MRSVSTKKIHGAKTICDIDEEKVYKPPRKSKKQKNKITKTKNKKQKTKNKKQKTKNSNKL